MIIEIESARRFLKNDYETQINKIREEFKEAIYELETKEFNINAVYELFDLITASTTLLDIYRTEHNITYPQLLKMINDKRIYNRERGYYD